jgi:hypothetical protein
MRELARVLRPEGWALILVPINAERTFEDRSVTSPEGRKRLFGQTDHVRRCGPDYGERLRQEGFVVLDLTAGMLGTEDELYEMGLSENELVFLCGTSENATLCAVRHRVNGALR